MLVRQNQLSEPLPERTPSTDFWKYVGISVTAGVITHIMVSMLGIGRPKNFAGHTRRKKISRRKRR